MKGDTYIDNSANYPDRIDIHEHKAPTDRSVRLLNEMKEKAKEDIIASIEVQDNVLNGVAISYCEPFAVDMTPNYTIHLKFKVNGKEYLINKTIDRWEASLKGEGDVTQRVKNFLQDALKSEIARIVFQYMMVDVINELKNN